MREYHAGTAGFSEAISNRASKVPRISMYTTMSFLPFWCMHMLVFRYRQVPYASYQCSGEPSMGGRSTVEVCRSTREPLILA